VSTSEYPIFVSEVWQLNASVQYYLAVSFSRESRESRDYWIGKFYCFLNNSRDA